MTAVEAARARYVAARCRVAIINVYDTDEYDTGYVAEIQQDAVAAAVGLARMLGDELGGGSRYRRKDST